MKYLVAAIAAGVLLAVAPGCNTLGRQPRLENAMLTPGDLKPGDSAVITVEVDDRLGIVGRVEGVVVEDPTIKLKLRDDGEPPDEAAGDHVWSLQVDVPFQAPSGEFALQLTAYRSDGTPVPVRSEEAGTVPLQVTLPVTIASP